MWTKLICLRPFRPRKDNNPGLFLDMPSLNLNARTRPKKALMNVDVVVWQGVRILVSLYDIKTYLLSGMSTPTIPTKHIGFIKQHDVTFVSDSRPSRNVTIYDINTYECHIGNMWQALHQRSNCVSGLVRFVRTWEAPKHISLVVSETYIMSDHNSRTGLFLDTLHPFDNVTFLKS
jgi:hypothetical protein